MSDAEKLSPAQKVWRKALFETMIKVSDEIYKNTKEGSGWMDVPETTLLSWARSTDPMLADLKTIAQETLTREGVSWKELG